MRFLRSVKPFLKEKSTIPQFGEVAGEDLEETTELNSDPESADEALPTDLMKASAGSVLITLFTSKPYNLWSLP